MSYTTEFPSISESNILLIMHKLCSLNLFHRPALLEHNIVHAWPRFHRQKRQTLRNSKEIKERSYACIMLHFSYFANGLLVNISFFYRLPKYACKFIEMCLMITADHGPGKCI